MITILSCYKLTKLPFVFQRFEIKELYPRGWRTEGEAGAQSQTRIRWEHGIKSVLWCSSCYYTTKAASAVVTARVFWLQWKIKWRISWRQLTPSPLLKKWWALLFVWISFLLMKLSHSAVFCPQDLANLAPRKPDWWELLFFFFWQNIPVLYCMISCNSLFEFLMQGPETWCGKEVGEAGEENAESHRRAHPLVSAASCFHTCSLAAHQVTETSVLETGVNYEDNCFEPPWLKGGWKGSDNISGTIPKAMDETHFKNSWKVSGNTKL